MSLKLVINTQDVAPLLSAPPVISDDINSVCRTLEFTLQDSDALSNYLGQSVQLYVGSNRWFYGFMEVRGWESNGQITYKAYDPLYFLKKNPDDYYFKNDTATQRAKRVLLNCGIKAGIIANTAAILAPKLYQKAEGDKVIIDSLARTYNATGKKYWLRFVPYENMFGASIFERVVPKEVWAFQRGVNVTNARFEESLEEHYNVIKLVNRETGKTVVKMDKEAISDYGARTYFEEVDKDVTVAAMTTQATSELKTRSKVTTTLSLEGFNANLTMPMFFSGDVIYVEEEAVNVMGAYHIKSVTQTVLSANDIQLAFELQDAPDVPTVQFSDDEKQKAATKSKTTKKKQAKKSTKKKEPAKDTKGTPGTYSTEMKGLIDKYGL